MVVVVVMGANGNQPCRVFQRLELELHCLVNNSPGPQELRELRSSVSLLQYCYYINYQALYFNRHCYLRQICKVTPSPCLPFSYWVQFFKRFSPLFQKEKKNMIQAGMHVHENSYVQLSFLCLREQFPLYIKVLRRGSSVAVQMMTHLSRDGAHLREQIYCEFVVLRHHNDVVQQINDELLCWKFILVVADKHLT